MVEHRSLIRRSCGRVVDAGDFLHAASSGLRASARRHAGSILAVALFLASAAHGQAQGVVAGDDLYGVPFGQDLTVEAPGVLSNDTYNGNPAEDHSATVELVDNVTYGYLSCPDTAFELCPDGSFVYTADPDYPGTDSFTYLATVGTETSLATVTLTACSAGLGATQYVCWKETPFLAKLGELGYGLVTEGFEDDAVWDASPSTSARDPHTAPSVVSQGIRWETNHPVTNEITTGSRPCAHGIVGGLRSPPRLRDRDSRRLRHQFPGSRVSVQRRFHGNP